MADRGPRIEAGDDLVPTYSHDEERRLAENLRALLDAIHRGEHHDTALTVEYLCELHRALFGGVRDHAGRYRRKADMSEVKTFGPNRSAHRDDVERLLRSLFDRLSKSVRSVTSNPDAPERDVNAVHIAVWAHAEAIRIHPFEDGNGRTGRALLNSLLVRMQLPPVALEVVKQTYIDCLNEYMGPQRNIQPSVDLILRLLDDSLAGSD